MAPKDVKCIVLLTFLPVVFSVSLLRGTVSTTTGTIRGLRVQGYHRLMNVYLGIPYAKPPVGDHRFRRPEPTTWDDTLVAMNLSNPCYHEYYDTEATSRNISESCLSLNIWSPYMRNGERLATLIWFPDNGRRSYANIDVFDGNYLAAENDIIVVSINYRSGALGFLYTGDGTVPGNMALLDQAMALKWLYNNIEHFGGDNERMTIFGDGLGATSASMHLVSPISRTYFSDAIIQRGGLGGHVSFTPISTALEYTKLFASKVGCSSDDSEEMVDCFKSLDVRTIMDNQEIEVNKTIIYPGPTVDGYFLTEEPDALIAEGNIKNAHILAGVNSIDNTLSDEESRMEAINNFVPVKSDFGLDAIRHEYRLSLLPARRPSMRDLFDDIVHDYNVVCPMVEFANAYAKTFEGADSVFVFVFDHNVIRHHKKGNEMGDFVDMVFGLPFKAGNYTDAEKVLSADIMRFFTNFVKTGNPNRENRYERRRVQWPAYTESEQKYITFRTSEPYVSQQGLRYAKCSFWKHLYPKVNGLKGAVCSSSSTPKTTVILVGIVLLAVFL